MSAQQLFGVLIALGGTALVGIVLLSVFLWLEHQEDRARQAWRIEDKSKGNRYPWERGVDE